MNIFVKFTQWCTCGGNCSDECIKELLINRKIRFSTAFDFNDFRELARTVDYRTINTFSTTEFENVRKQAFGLYRTNKEQFLLDSRSLPYRNASMVELNGKLANEMELKDCELAQLLTWMLYRNSGIFCVSDQNVLRENNPKFVGDLMFGHYANKSTGIACLYRDIKQKFEKVGYSDDKYIDIFTDTEIKKGNIKILNKTTVWRYEQEYRIFNSPGLHTMDECGVELCAIFYTPKFEQEERAYLCELNEKFFGNRLIIKEVYPYINPNNGFMYDGDIEPARLSDLLDKLSTENGE